jgi:hypothetical protein
VGSGQERRQQNPGGQDNGDRSGLFVAEAEEIRGRMMIRTDSIKLNIAQKAKRID